MNVVKPTLLSETTDEVSALIEALHEAGRRLEDLTAGEVDAVADRDGRTFLLHSAQEQLRHIEAEKQAAILNALPAHIAMLDHQGIIVSVNEAWRGFTGADALQGSECGVGINYLQVCANTRGEHSSEAHQVAEGIRSVLGGGAKGFSIEYPCHSPAEQRWFLVTVTPLAGDSPNGAVVMHSDVTAQRQAEKSLRISESRFRQMADNISEVFFLQDLDRSHVYYVSRHTSKSGVGHAKACMQIRRHGRIQSILTIATMHSRISASASNPDSTVNIASSAPMARSAGYIAEDFRFWTMPAIHTGQQVSLQTSPRASRRPKNFAGAKA